MGKKKNVTFDDIAKFTKFSKTTISRFFNNPDSLTLENQEIISNALEELNYKENKVAKILANGKTEFIGIVIPSMFNHYYSEMLNQILLTYETFGYKFLVFVGNEREDVERRYIEELLAEHYGDNTIVLTEIGNLDFSPAGMADIVSGRKLTYDDYIDIQIQSSGKQRSWFEMCYYNIPSNFKGCIEKKAKKNICFKRIYVSGMYPDGDCFKGKEDHVWMDIQGFEDFKAGDCVSFYADVYRYVKTGNGKVLDYSLKNPQDIERIGSYQLPSDDDLANQSINEIICETCFLSDHCNRTYCMRNQEELQVLREQMSDLLKHT